MATRLRACRNACGDSVLTLRRYNATLGMEVIPMAENRRTTVYLDSDLHRALRLKAIETDSSISDLVNGAVRHPR